MLLKNIKNLLNNDLFINFKKEHPDAYLAHIFFNNKTWEVGFFLPKENKVATFNLNELRFISKEETLSKKIIPELKLDNLKDLEEAKEALKKKGLYKGIFQLVILQVIDNIPVWNFTFMNGLSLINIRVNAKDLSIISNNEGELFSIN